MHLPVEKTLRNVVAFFITFFVFNSCLFADQQLIIEPDMGRAPLLNAIKQANSSIDVVMYGFTDFRFAGALVAAQNNHKNVRVLLQHHPYKFADENQAVINYLQKSHIPLQWPDGDYKLTHQKTFLIDNTSALVMTFNLTHSTFKKERNFALLINDPNLVNEIQQVFINDWHHEKSDVTQADLLWSPNNTREKLQSFIRSAKSNIQVYAEGLSDYKIVGELAKAASNGIKVQILTSLEADRTPNKQMGYLEKSGAELRYDKEYIIHAKVIIADHSRAVLGSINFTRPSIDENRELAVITQDKKVIAELEQVFERDWQHANDTTTTTIEKPIIKTSEATYLINKSIRELAKLTKLQHQHTYKKQRRKAH